MSKTRLTCPNCGAQYEVPTEVIPDAGRDVQCSSCGHTWFQTHPDFDVALAEELGVAAPDESWTPQTEAETPPPPPPQPPAAERRGIDPSVADVLREEAALEAERRAAEGQALETQPDLGLASPDEDEQARRARESRERMAQIRGPQEQMAEDALPPHQDPGPEHAPEEVAAAAAAGSRRELLPNVDEINQTLRSEAEPRHINEVDDSYPEETPRRGGFARGFFLIVLLAALLIALYIFAPQIKEQLPAVAPVLDSYVSFVDQGRAWLDTQVGALLATLDSMSSEAAPAEGESAAPQEADTPAPEAGTGE